MSESVLARAQRIVRENAETMQHGWICRAALLQAGCSRHIQVTPEHSDSCPYAALELLLVEIQRLKGQVAGVEKQAGGILSDDGASFFTDGIGEWNLQEYYAEMRTRQEEAKKEIQRLEQERDELRQWQVNVTSALCVAFPGGVAYADAAKKAKALAEERNAAWEAIQRGWEIEPREYFEAEAPQNGFRHPLAQAIHHLWKRDVKVEAAEAEAARHRADALLMLHAYETDNRPPMDILTRLRGLRAELLLGIR